MYLFSDTVEPNANHYKQFAFCELSGNSIRSHSCLLQSHGGMLQNFNFSQ